MADFAELPGAELVLRGVADAATGTESVAALLVTIAAPRLRRLGVAVSPERQGAEDAELRLYRRLLADGVPDAFSRYNALLRELGSFAHALEQRQGRARRAAEPA